MDDIRAAIPTLYCTKLIPAFPVLNPPLIRGGKPYKYPIHWLLEQELYLICFIRASSSVAMVTSGARTKWSLVKHACLFFVWKQLINRGEVFFDPLTWKPTQINLLCTVELLVGFNSVRVHYRYLFILKNPLHRNNFITNTKCFGFLKPNSLLKMKIVRKILDLSTK